MNAEQIYDQQGMFHHIINDLRSSTVVGLELEAGAVICENQIAAILCCVFKNELDVIRG
jgi:hypothetical protein